MRKAISIILATAMVLSLCACGGSQSTPPAGDSEKTQEQTVRQLLPYTFDAYTFDASAAEF